MADNRGGVVRGAVWMTVIGILLFWLPVFGPLVAGVVGGKKAGGVGKAVLAAFLPGVVIAVLLALFGTMLTGLPLMGMLLAMGAGFVYLAEIGMLLLGAILGGILA